MRHALSFDVEEYFQVANFSAEFPRESWDGVPTRLAIGMEPILAALEAHGAKATFFFLGWIAERYPEWVVRCLEAGHEVASHGFDHQFIWNLGPEGFDEDLLATESALAAAGAPRPRGFRACTFTITQRSWWAFDKLAARGYEYDSSVHPIRHPVYGVPSFEPGISWVREPSMERGVIEFPVSTLPLFGRNLPMGGGGYFRLLPGWVTRAAIARLESLGRPASIYLHPWEFDPMQPRCPASAGKRFRHYLNLDQTLPRLEAMLARFEFTTYSEVLGEWAACGKVGE